MKEDWEVYRDTGLLGTYKPEMAELREEEDGSVNTVYQDTQFTATPDGFIQERRMIVKGKVFHVVSVFPGEATATPTDKMLSLIDAELEKEARSA